MAITPLPSAPLPTDTTAQFNTKAFAWVAALDTFTTQANALATATNTNEVNAETAEANAEAAQAAAEAAQLAAETAQTAAELAETNAETAATAAVNAKNAAEAAWDAFDDKYLGAKASDPTVDNDGNPLQNGAFYVNTTTGYIRVYPNSSIGWVQGISATAGVESINGQQGAVTGVLFDSDIGSDIQAYDSNLTSFVNTFTLPTTDGTANQVLATNGSGTLGFQTVSSISSNKVNMTLAENMSAGAVAQLKSDGTIETVKETIATTIPSATAASFATTNIYDEYSVATDPFNSGKFVIAYRGESGYYQGKIQICSVSGSTFTIGDQYVFNSSPTSPPFVAFDPNNANKLIVLYSDGSSPYHLYARVGTISGTSISFGSQQLIAGTWAQSSYKLIFDKNTSNKFSVAIQLVSNGNGYICAGSYSGDTITVGSLSNFTSESMSGFDFDYVPNTADKVVIAFNYSGNSYRPVYKVATISGTSFSYGSEYTNTNLQYANPLTFNPSTPNQFITGNNGTAICIGTVSGTTITFGDNISPTDGFSSFKFTRNIPNTFALFYTTGSGAKAKIGKIDGSSISLSSGYTIYASGTIKKAYDFDYSTSRFVGAHYLNSSTHVILAGTVGDSNLNSGSILGILQESGTTGQSKAVSLKSGIDSTRSGLTVGSTYYAQSNGTVSTSSTTPAVKIGKAITTSSILLQSTLGES